MPIIEVKNLVKQYKIIEKENGLIGYFKNLVKPKYKELTAVDDLSFEVHKGEILGLLRAKWKWKINNNKLYIIFT